MTRYARATGVLWRLADDRVLVRRAGDPATAMEAVLHGATAVVWLALDGPRSEDELCTELAAAGSTAPGSDVAAALAILCDHRLVET